MTSTSAPSVVVLAGATGDLGRRIGRALRSRAAMVRALVRPDASRASVASLEAIGAETIVIAPDDEAALLRSCAGADCVVSAVSGLAPVINDYQGRLLKAAIAAGVPRFIPADYAGEYLQVAAGANRNFDLRRQFACTLDNAAIRVTSILNGAFVDILLNQAPIILHKPRLILYWGNPEIFPTVRRGVPGLAGDAIYARHVFWFEQIADTR